MEFSTGAVRDDHGDKGRMDLMPFNAMARILTYQNGVTDSLPLESCITFADAFVRTRNTDNLVIICTILLKGIGFNSSDPEGDSLSNGLIEVSKHCQRGAEFYGEHNIRKGLPFSSLLDSGLRHLVKHLGGWTDEPHLVASAWNFMWLLEEALTRPELDDLYRVEKKEVEF